LIPPTYVARARIFKQSMGARNRVGIGLSYQSARLHRLAVFIPEFLKRFQIRSQLASGIRSLESIPGLLKHLQIQAQATLASGIGSLESIPGLLKHLIILGSGLYCICSSTIEGTKTKRSICSPTIKGTKTKQSICSLTIKETKTKWSIHSSTIEGTKSKRSIHSSTIWIAIAIDQQSLPSPPTPWLSVIAFFSHCPVGEGTTEYTKLRFPEQGWRVH
jgi:hypothetical protein